MRILIKNAEVLQNRQDILIEGNSIAKIGNALDLHADKIIDGNKKAVVPGMFNGHTHAAMTLMRGFADDMPLMPWLEEKIWPLEAKLTEEDVYWGAKLACLEMIKTGTTTMVDMYHLFPATARAVDEMGIRCMLTHAHFDFGQAERLKDYQKVVERQMKQMEEYSDRIQYALG
ncbi:MAG TPA: amidohydrolase family protein, partial [Prolixibacteraceae bacterium]|nr:amidohydrolase family protein [Prolixibacteraceae bacterium]